jgi:hypothetical protein
MTLLLYPVRNNKYHYKINPAWFKGPPKFLTGFSLKIGMGHPDQKETEPCHYGRGRDGDEPGQDDILCNSPSDSGNPLSRPHAHDAGGNNMGR